MGQQKVPDWSEAIMAIVARYFDCNYKLACPKVQLMDYYTPSYRIELGGWVCDPELIHLTPSNGHISWNPGQSRSWSPEAVAVRMRLIHDLKVFYQTATDDTAYFTGT